MTIEIKVMNSEVVTHYGETKLRFYGRTKSGGFETITVRGYSSYFFADTLQVAKIEDSLMGTDVVRGIDHQPKQAGYLGQKVSRIDVVAPWKRTEILDTYPELNTYWNDVWLDNQFRIEHGLFTGLRAPRSEVDVDEIETFDTDEDWAEPSISYVDIETDDRGDFVKDGSRPILSVVGYNSYEDEYVGFYHTGPDRSIAECFPQGKPPGLDRVEVTTTEKSMLEKFTDWMDATNPDMVTGWNFIDFDARYLSERFDKIDGLDPGSLSREGYSKFNAKRVQWKGRTVYDLQHQYVITQRGELDSERLDFVAQDVLGEAKLDHSGLGYHEMWAEHPAHLMEYNAVDVELCVKINETADVISFWSTLRDTLGLDFEDTTKKSDFVEMQARRDLWSHNQVAPPTDYGRPEDDYDGGFVFDAHTGATSNVVAIDLSSLYPNTMHMANTSPESKVDSLEAASLREKGTPVCAAPNGAFFRLDEDGVYRRIVDQAIGWKKEYKALRNDHADQPTLYEMYSEKYDVSKEVTNAGYGVSGWEPFFLYDQQVAEAITLLGQACIKETARFINEETVGNVIYGDTDSCYVALPEAFSPEECIEWATETCRILSEDHYPVFAQEEFGIPPRLNRWNIEPESYLSVFFQAGKKKRYAYRAIWMDGKWLDTPKDAITGFERTDTSPLTRETQKKLFTIILNGADQNEVMELISDAAGRIDPADPDWDAIGIPMGIGQELDEYDVETAHIRGARFMNALSGTHLEKGDKPRRVYLKPTLSVGENTDTEMVDVISFEEFREVPEDVANGLKVDAKAMTDKTIRKPLGPICTAVGVDVDAAINGQTQTGLAGFM